MNLTAQQLQAVKDGAAVRLPVPDFGMECVVLRADLYERVETVLDDSIGRDELAHLVQSGMREYDEDDPLLQSYQQYRNG